MNQYLFEKLQKLGFVYDSMIKYSKNTIVKEDYNYVKENENNEFPIMVINAYLFMYMKI